MAFPRQDEGCSARRCEHALLCGLGPGKRSRCFGRPRAVLRRSQPLPAAGTFPPPAMTVVRDQAAPPGRGESGISLPRVPSRRVGAVSVRCAKPNTRIGLGSASELRVLGAPSEVSVPLMKPPGRAGVSGTPQHSACCSARSQRVAPCPRGRSAVANAANTA